jgi:hypothetical protein
MGLNVDPNLGVVKPVAVPEKYGVGHGELSSGIPPAISLS